MFCFGRRAERQRRSNRPRPGPSEDACREVGPDGKYEADIPTPNEFSLANVRNLEYIDSERRDDDSSGCADPGDVFLAGGAVDPSRPQERSPVDSVSSTDSEALAVPRIVEHLSADDLDGGNSSASTADIGRLFSSTSSHHSSMDSAIDAIDIGNLTQDASTNPCRSPAPGPRFKLLHEGDIHVCRLNHSKNVIGKILSSKFLRRWESHRLTLGDDALSSKTPGGVFESELRYSEMEEIYQMVRWDSNHRYCIQIVLVDGSLLLQAKNSYVRDQWFHSISWKRNLFRYKNILLSIKNNNILHRELKCFIDFVMVTPLQDECFTSGPLEIISKLLTENQWKNDGEDIVLISGTIIGTATLPESLALTLGKICRTQYLSPQVKGILHHAARRILKHNVDFGKAPHLRRFLQDYISALYRSHSGIDVLRTWIGTVHGPGFNCPHPRVLPNLAAVCFAAFHSIPPLASPESEHISNSLNRKYEYNIADFENDQPLNNNIDNLELNDLQLPDGESNISIPSENVNKKYSVSYLPSKIIINENPALEENDMVCFTNVIYFMSLYPDWAESLGAVLQPVPIPSHVIQSKSALAPLASAVVKLGTDDRCAVHSHVLPLRPGRPGWLQILCPTYNNPEPERLQQWGEILDTLLNCCCKRKCFLLELAKMLPACLLLALRAHQAGLESLCLMLEWEVLEDEQARVEAVQALRSTPPGRRALHTSCQRQVHLKKLQQKGGPRRLTLPSCATDADVARLLSAGSFGNLECLSLAFTHVTSAVAEQLIKLPSLRYLNLWATQFGDAGVLLIVEHLHRLQVLNLCETPVSDVGIEALAALSNLRKLNLNSTKLSAATWARLQPMLPALQECDVRYTDAW